MIEKTPAPVPPPSRRAVALAGRPSGTPEAAEDARAAPRVRGRDAPRLVRSQAVPEFPSNRRRAALRVIPGGPAMTDDDAEDGFLGALGSLEAILRAEAWFLDRVWSRIETARPLDAAGIKQTLNHDFLIHLAQFLFLFRAIDCRDRNAVSRFIDSHNAKVRSDIARGVAGRSEREKRKAIFTDARRAKVVESCAALNAPAFSVTELAHFLTDFMSEPTATRMINDLVFAGVLGAIEDPRADAATNRVLIRSPGFLEDTYQTSLLRMRAAILAETDMAGVVQEPAVGGRRP